MFRTALLLMAALSAQTCFAPLAAQEREVVGEMGFYSQTLIDEDGVSPRFFLEGSNTLGGSLGVWGFGYGERDYISVVAGLYLDVFETENASLSIGMGGGSAFYPDETGEWGLESRYASFSEASVGRVSLSAYYENGRSGESWYQGLAEVRASEVLSIGVLTQKDDGTGPKLTIHIQSAPATIWVAPMFSREGGQRVLIGADLVLEALR